MPLQSHVPLFPSFCQSLHPSALWGERASASPSDTPWPFSAWPLAPLLRASRGGRMEALLQPGAACSRWGGYCPRRVWVTDVGWQRLCGTVKVELGLLSLLGWRKGGGLCWCLV